MDYIHISATVRRVDGGVIDINDLYDFSDVWKENYDPGQWNGEMPCHSNDLCELWASYDNYARYEEACIVEFAKSHPHLMIRITVRNEEDTRCAVDYLYHADLYEELHEIRYMPQPTTISWPRSHSHNNTFLNNKTFLKVFGEMVRLSLEDMMQNTTSEELGRYIFESLGWQEGNEHLMFSAIVGWDINELIRRTNEALEEKKDE